MCFSNTAVLTLTTLASFSQLSLECNCRHTTNTPVANLGSNGAIEKEGGRKKGRHKLGGGGEGEIVKGTESEREAIERKTERENKGREKGRGEREEEREGQR